MSNFNSQNANLSLGIINNELGIEDSFLAKLLYLERRVRKGTQGYSKFSHFSELPVNYQPDSKEKSFFLPIYSVPKDHLKIFLANPLDKLLQNYIFEDKVSFCVHPVDLEKQDEKVIHDLLNYEKKGFLEVSPTSSSRTVLILDSGYSPHAIKCHCPLRISRFFRDLEPLTIYQSLIISSLLDETNIAHLPETIGIAFPHDQNHGWGFIIREMTPRPYSTQKELMIPCFALYGQDVNTPDSEPLIVKMIKYQKQNPKNFVLENIMFPIIEDFVFFFKSQGILLEPHGQNSLLEVDEYLNPKRIVHRDFDLYVDINYRHSLGLSLEGFQIPTMPSEPPPGGIHSLIYDHSIAHNHFDYLAEVLNRYFDVDKKSLQIACKEKFRTIFPDSNLFFSSKVYYYSDKAISYNNFPLVETNEMPVWRP